MIFTAKAVLEFNMIYAVDFISSLLEYKYIFSYNKLISCLACTFGWELDQIVICVPQSISGVCNDASENANIPW